MTAPDIEVRCQDCVREADAAVNDARWILTAGGDPGSAAMEVDLSLVRLWSQVGDAHDEGSRP